MLPASIPATTKAIRIPVENLGAILPDGLDMEGYKEHWRNRADLHPV